jgi:hypothetical protein
MMRLIPIPTNEQDIKETSRVWLPFLPDISRRSKEPIDDLIDLVIRKDVQVLVAWDEESKTAKAIAGLRLCRRGQNLIGEIVWCTGRSRAEWQHLLSQIEQYLKDIGCIACRPICRLGWSPLLKQHGYKTTHLMMEKSLG